MQDLMHAGWANKRPQGGIDAMCNSSVCKWSGKAIAKDCAGGEHGRTRKSAADEVELDLEALTVDVGVEISPVSPGAGRVHSGSEMTTLRERYVVYFHSVCSLTS